MMLQYNGSCATWTNYGGEITIGKGLDQIIQQKTVVLCLNDEEIHTSAESIIVFLKGTFC